MRSFFADHVKPGPLGGLVNCAGEVERISIISAGVAEWEPMLAVNLSSAFLMIREFVAYESDPRRCPGHVPSPLLRSPQDPLVG